MQERDNLERPKYSEAFNVSKTKLDRDFIKEQWSKLWESDHPSLVQLAFRCGFILLAYYLLNHFYYGSLEVDEFHYRHSFIFPRYIVKLFTHWQSILLIPFLYLLFLHRSMAFLTWTELKVPKGVKLFASITVGVMTWAYATTEINYFLGQAFLLDRFLMITMMLLSFWRPIFLIPFLMTFFSFLGQFFLVPNYSWAIQYLPIHIIFFVITFFMLFLINKKWYRKEFAYLLGCLFICSYFFSGFGKVNITWFAIDQIILLLPATYSNGWLSFLDIETINSITHAASSFNLPIKILVLLLECGGIFFFFYKRASMFFLIGWVFMHLGIFFVSGICFWLWSILDISILLLFFSRSDLIGYSFDWSYRLLAIPIVLSGYIWCHPVILSWFDIPLNYTYKFVGITENGEQFNLQPSYFQPYSDQFTTGSFRFLYPDKQLRLIWGTTNDKRISEFLSKNRSKDEILEFEQKIGKNLYNKVEGEKLGRFIRTFIRNKNTLNGAPWKGIRPPRQLVTIPVRQKERNSDFVKIEVYHLTTYFGKNGYQELRSTKLEEIALE